MKQWEIDFLQLFRKYMSGNINDFIYVPASELYDTLGDLRRTASIIKKYQVFEEEIVGVKHFVMNPQVEIMAPVLILSLIKQTCESWDKIHRGQTSDIRVSPYGGISDDDIPF